MAVEQHKPDVLSEKGKKVPTFKYVKLKFAERGYALLSKQYVNRTKPLVYECPTHGRQEISWQYFIRGYGCTECIQIHHPIDFIRNEFNRRGYKLLSTEYHKETDMLRFTCPKHGKKEVMWRTFRRRKHGCPDCRNENGNERKPRELSAKDKSIIEKKFDRLTVKRAMEARKGSRIQFECECSCGNTTLATRYQLEYKLKKSCGCLRQGRHEKSATFNGETRTYREWAESLDISVETFANRLKTKVPFESMVETSRKKNLGRKNEFAKEMKAVHKKLKSIDPTTKQETFEKYDFVCNGKKIVVLYAHGNEMCKGGFCFSYLPKYEREAKKWEFALPNGKFKTAFHLVCDVVIFVVSNQTECNMWVIPSDELNNNQQGMALLPHGNSKYNQFIEKWGFI